MTEPENPQRETDLLRYRGNSVPRLLRLAWTVLVIFCVIYLARYMLPDLRLWIQKMKS